MIKSHVHTDSWRTQSSTRTYIRAHVVLGLYRTTGPLTKIYSPPPHEKPKQHAQKGTKKKSCSRTAEFTLQRWRVVVVEKKNKKNPDRHNRRPPSELQLHALATAQSSNHSRLLQSSGTTLTPMSSRLTNEHRRRATPRSGRQEREIQARVGDGVIQKAKKAIKRGHRCGCLGRGGAGRGGGGGLNYNRRERKLTLSSGGREGRGRRR